MHICTYSIEQVEELSCAVFSPGFFEGIVVSGSGDRARRWEKCL